MATNLITLDFFFLFTLFFPRQGFFPGLRLVCGFLGFPTLFPISTSLSPFAFLSDKGIFSQ